jgi:hypothetical protein
MRRNDSFGIRLKKGSVSVSLDEEVRLAPIRCDRMSCAAVRRQSSVTWVHIGTLANKRTNTRYSYTRSIILRPSTQQGGCKADCLVYQRFPAASWSENQYFVRVEITLDYLPICEIQLLLF